MEFKGTKGKWEFYPISKESNGFISVEIPMGSITVYNGIYPYIFEKDKEKCVEILEANAKLIAAAPEMFEMLVETFNLCDKIQFPTEEELKNLKIKARQLLTKITEQ